MTERATASGSERVTARWARDAAGRLKSVDDAWMRLVGGPRDGSVDPIFDCVADDDRPRLRAAHADGDPGSGQTLYRVELADGSRRWIRSTWQTEADGTRSGVEEDVTQERKEDDERQRLARLELVGRLAPGIAHDFNNALTVVLACADTLRSLEPGEEDTVPELAEEIRSASLRAAALSRQLLMFTRETPFERRLLDVADTARSMQKLLRKLVGDSAEVEVRASAACLIEGDAARLEQLLAGIVLKTAGNDDNASIRLDVAPDGAETGRVLISAIRTDGRDPAPDLAPFVDLASLCGQLGGACEEGDGPATRAWLPAARRRRQAVAPVSLERIDARVLVVDDDAALRQVAATCLRGTGATVIQASTPHEALALLRDSEPVDVIVVDVIMPGMNGMELSERATALQPKAKLVFMSGFSAEHALVSRLRAEGRSFLQKPFSADAFRAAVASAAR